MIKPYLVIAISAVASVVSITAPELIEHFGEGLHFATLIISGHHIIEEIGSGISKKKLHQELT